MPCSIQLEGVNLCYPSHIYNATTLKKEVFQLLKLQREKKLLRDVHALRDVSFNVTEGERVGVIGLNGAGKSTLLKAIGGIYPLESGKITVSGAVRGMFDLSLGFELESTGRENILYRGLMLGLHPSDIREKQQEIIDFAELGEFIDYPIKSYSAGMLVRLAFAITTSVTGEVLLVDEVIGAGDASFAAKARNRISGVMSVSKILILVSHDLSSINELCTRALWMEKGRLNMDSTPKEVTAEYMKQVQGV